MKYVSTRDKTIIATFEEALFSGYAPDGGLFVPQQLPKISIDELKSYSCLSFPALAFNILRKLISPDEVADDELQNICSKSFFDGFDAPNDSVVPVVQVGSIFVAELFHGPTFCFKDLGMQGVINLLSHFSAKRKRRTTLLAATTGDTGPAAVHAVNNCNNPYLSIVVHYPNNQISAFQRRQMTTVDSPMVKVVSFEGGGDDMDRPIKELTTDSAQLCGINSFNIGRPMMQMVHFFWTYLRICEQLGKVPGETTIDVVIPTGAMGNTAGGYMSKNMGLPISKLCLGTNTNDITHRVISTGKFHRAHTMEKTLSEAINIQVPYNFERVLYFLTGQNDKLVKEMMAMMDATGKLDLDNILLDKLQAHFSSARITDDEMCKAMVAAKKECGYFIDPHTAIAFAAADKLGYNPLARTIEGESPSIVAIFATASPCKFKEAVTVALKDEGWKEYEDTVFPNRAKEFINAPEIAPTKYKFEKGRTLEEIQVQWKEMTQLLVDAMRCTDEEQ